MDQLTTLQVIGTVCGLAYFAVCGGWGAYVSTVLNRDWIEGCGLGLTLGPFGVVVAACLPTLHAQPAAASDDDDDDLPGTRRYSDAEWARHLAREKPRAN